MAINDKNKINFANEKKQPLLSTLDKKDSSNQNISNKIKITELEMKDIIGYFYY
jgi:hypothetical protein